MSGQAEKLNAMMHKFKVGDYVFHWNEEHGTLGCVVERIGRGDRIKVSDRGWVSARKCQLQSEWAKENDQ